MCFLIPFIQSLTIAANSFTLVVIAFDRYLAVTNAIKEKWQPGLIHSIIICTFIWIFAGLIASGALWNYEIFVVYIVRDSNPVYIYKAYMCSAEKFVNRKYYTLVFACVFTPTTLVFIVLNSIIAKRIWDRRRPFSLKSVKDSNGNAIVRTKASVTNTTSLDGNYRKVTSVCGNGRINTYILFCCLYYPFVVPFPSSYRSTAYDTPVVKSRSDNDLRKNSTKNLREARHIRMFKIVFLIISIFLICRLPSWIFVLIKMYSAQSTYSEYWIMHYSFGILVLLNCLLNPLIYTFLSTTLNAWDKIRSWLKCFCRPCLSYRFRGDLNPLNESVTEESAEVGQYKQRNTSQRN